MTSRSAPVLVVLALLLSPTVARADAESVGLGIAGGVSYSPSQVQSGNIAGAGFAWGFFVDIPLITTFYISPAAMLYQLNLGNGGEPATDIDLNFKFIVPLGAFRLGFGINVGITSVERSYHPHIGALGYFSWNFVSNLDAFFMLQYKRLFRDPGSDLDNIHNYLGVMFRF